MSADLLLEHPFRLIPEFKERIWGVDNLSNWFPGVSGQSIGEAWFTSPESRTESGMLFSQVLEEHPELLGTGSNAEFPQLCPLLVKFLFTSSRLSVQVHPKDSYAQKHHQSLGKTEAWFVVEARPAAEVALGFREQISPDRLKSSAQSGEIEALLDWKPVQAGDLIYVPAGTVHAIGAGLTVCEIQQNSDITYRLYDYGRPRELHLNHGSAVSDLGPYTYRFDRKELGAGRLILAESDYFRIEHLTQSGRDFELAGDLPHYCILVSLKGNGTIAGKPFAKGQVWMVPAGSAAVKVKRNSAEWLLTYSGTEQSPPIAFS